MDVRMPIMDGLAATQEIRKLDRPDAAAIPIVALTANAFEKDVRQCLEAGMDAHLSKPVDIATGCSESVRVSMETAGLDAATCIDIMGHLAEQVPRDMEHVFEQNAQIPGMDELREHLLGPVTQSCAQTLNLLD